MSLVNRDLIVDPEILAALVDAEKKTAAYVTQLKALAKQAEAVNKAIGNSQSWGDLNKAIDQNITVTNEVISKQREAILVQQEELKLKQLQRKETNELAKSEEKLRKEQEKQKKATEDNNSLWKKNTDQLAKLKKEAREAALAYGENSKEAKKAASAANELGDKLNRIDKSIGNNQRNVGNYSSVWKDVKSNLVGVAVGIGGVAAVIGGITSLVQRAWRNTVDFGKALSSLQAITGATSKDMAFFSKEAVKMSNQTQKSAIEIVKAFELVGSKAPDLLKNRDALKEVTKWSIILAESSGGQLQLADSVNAVTAAMAVFQKPASEAAAIANTMAAGSLAGSAGVDQIAESFKSAGPTLKASNLTLEQSVALTELLGEYQIYGSEAGNKLSSSLVNLKKAQLGYQSGVFNLNDALVEANQKLANFGSQMGKDKFIADLFGKENINVGTILVDNVQKYNDLTAAVTGTNTAMEQQAIQNDNVAGSIVKMTNKWDSFMLGISKSNGVIKSFFDGLSNAIDGVSWLMMNQGEKQADLVDRLFNIQLKRLSGMSNEDQIARINALIQIQGEQLEKTRKQIENTGSTWDIVKDQIGGLNPVFGGIIAGYDALTDTSDSNKESLINQREAIKQVIQKLMEKQKELKKTVLIQQQANEVEAPKETGGTGIKKSYETKIELKNQDIKLTEEQINMDQILFDQQKVNAQKLAQYKDELRQAEWDKTVEDNIKKKELEQNFYDSSVNLVNTLFDRRIQTLENEKNAIDAKYAKILDNEALTEDQRSAYEAMREAEKQKLEEKQNKARRRQAQFEKAISLMNIYNSTAEAVMKAWEMGPVLGPVFAGLAAATGAIQAATVIAQPIPQYFKGTTNSKEGIAEVAEKGAELIIDKRHGAWLAEKRQHTYLSGGSTVLTASQTAQVLDNVRRRDIMAKSNDSIAQIPMLNKLLLDNINQGKSIEQAIKSNRNKTNIYLSPGVDKGLQVRAQSMYNHLRGN